MLTVESGSTLALEVGYRGSGGRNGTVRYDHGISGGAGKYTYVRQGERILVAAAGGRPGSGGDASNLVHSRYGGARGAGGPEDESGCAHRTHRTVTPGKPGTKGGDGSRNSLGRSGESGGPALYLEGCPAAGTGGDGGNGAGDTPVGGTTNDATRSLPSPAA